MKGLVVIPAFNEGSVILDVLKKVPREVLGFKLETLVINDGSVDNTEELLKNSKVNFVSHPINRGLGAALGTGFEYAREKKYDFLVTLDSDGQHDPKEMQRLVKPVVMQEADFIIGTRVQKKGMPKTRKMLAFLASLATWTLTGVWTSDSQSGYRAFSKNAINKILIEVDRMEVASDFFRQSKEKGLKFQEVSIKPIYTKYSLKKGQNFFNSFNIIGKLAIRKLIK